MKRALLILLALLFATSVQAHDPYEITSVVYVRTNRIELFMEMEFRTGMKLAGLNPSREIAAARQFEAVQTQLRDLAGSFFIFTAGNNGVLPLCTNVELGVEDHIRLQVDFASTPYRPLQFTARGLRGAMEDAYGTSLTVLDMVHQKVLGQTTLFANSAPIEFPSRVLPAAAPGLQLSNAAETIVVSVLSTVSTNSPASVVPKPQANRGVAGWFRICLAALAGLAVTVFILLGVSRARAKSQ